MSYDLWTAFFFFLILNILDLDTWSSNGYEASSMLSSMLSLFEAGALLFHLFSFYPTSS